MHELSIAISMVDMAAEEAAQRGDVKVNAIYLKLGAMSGVVKDALLFSYDVVCEGTPMEGSRLVIEEVPIIVFCPKCEIETAPVSINNLCCPTCETPTPQVVRGREMEVTALEIE
ncbi:MAG: hydrogenase maturation nickel metallochaperone HypA [Acidobacteria bacterium]|jgi:hydrogenase nickel incorporation protein HypA/HybF|nr:hydrogenase maturation nickel metallochaperone HypA [Acidobacteriota bacterium]